jgi:murein DD-endopeptidase MepM/ murein hydrolase activator NlpD
MRDTVSTKAAKPNLGRNIGGPDWYLQLGLLVGLSAFTVSLGFLAPREPRAPAPAVPTALALSEGDFISMDFPQRRLALPTEVRPVEKLVTVRSGDTLDVLLQRAGVSARESYDTIKALSAEYNPRRLQVGQELALGFMPDNDAFTGLRLQTDVDRSVVVSRADDGSFAASEETIPLAKSEGRAGTVIDNSLYLAAERVGVPAAVIVEMIRMYSYEVDFQRDLRSGDRFEVYYDRFADADGNVVKNGDIQFASLTLSGKTLDLYRFTTHDGDTDYFHADGKSTKRFLMKTPVDGARISGNFGMRNHPILGYTRMHKGTDFAVPTGTPIMAAGDGVIERASRWGSFGNYIRIRHNGKYKTAYAHLSRYAKGMHPGVRVKQGQIIGYVGMTGGATGPHLHYEVLVNGKQVNAQKLDLPTGRTLAGADLKAFEAMLPKLQTRIAATPMSTQVAANQE